MVQAGGDAVKADEPLVELETDKVTLEVNAPGAGVLIEIIAETGQTVRSARCSAARRAAPPRRRPRRRRRAAPQGRARAAAPPRMPPAPSAAKIAAEQRIDLSGVAGSGKRGQVLKGDVLEAVATAAAPAPAPAPVAARRRRRRPSPVAGRARRRARRRRARGARAA